MRWVRAAAAALVGVALLAGCSEERQANATLPSTTSAAAESTEALPPLGPPDLPMPPEARANTAEGAAAFVDYYLRLINRTNADMDPQYLRQLASQCITCARLADETATDAAAGYHYVGGELTVDGDLSAALTEPGRAEAAFLVDQAPLEVQDSNGQPVNDLTFDAIDNMSSGSSAVWDDDLKTWRMSDLTLG
jgi:hypothetical protein